MLPRLILSAAVTVAVLSIGEATQSAEDFADYIEVSTNYRRKLISWEVRRHQWCHKYMKPTEQELLGYTCIGPFPSFFKAIHSEPITIIW